MTPMNSQPVLDHGYVACLSTSNDGQALSNIQKTFLGDSINQKLLRIANATFVIKMPLFVQINVSQYDLEIIPTNRLKEIEAYIPDVTDIKCPNTQDSQRIKEYLEQTTEAIILNGKAFPMEGCNEFVAQSQMPISVYNEVIVHGSLYEWLKFLKQKKLPKPVEAYRYQIEQILKADWKNLDKLKTMV